MPPSVSSNPNVKTLFPQSAALGLQFVSTAPGVDHPGFDEDDVKAKLGATRFNNLMAKVKFVFSCGHRVYPANDARGAGCEAHAIYASDLEAFLKGGG